MVSLSQLRQPLNLGGGWWSVQPIAAFVRHYDVLIEIARSDSMSKTGFELNPAAIFCGDRNWTDWKAVNDVMVALSPRLVIEGDARGADRMAAKTSLELDIALETYPARWDQHGRAAGPIRNQHMLHRLLAQAEPRLVVAFHDNIDESKGTKDMIDRARKAGVPVKLVKHARS